MLKKYKIMKKYGYLLSLLGFILNIYVFTSCVSAKKFQALEAEHQKILIEEKGAKNQLERERAALEVKEKELIASKAENERLSQEVINRASAGTQDIATLQKRNKNLNDSLTFHKNYFEQQKSRWQNTHDSLDYIIDKNKKEYAKSIKQKEENIEDLQDSIKVFSRENDSLNVTINKANEAQKIAMIAQKNAEEEKKVLEDKIEKLLKEKKSLTQSNEETDNSSLTDEDKKELGKDLAHYFLSLDADKARVFNEKGNYVIEIDEHFLFGANGRISPKSAEVLNESINIMQKYKKLSLVVETTGTGTEDRPQKAELVRKFLADGELNASSSPKNFTPVAFDTSKENIRKTKIYIK